MFYLMIDFCIEWEYNMCEGVNLVKNKKHIALEVSVKALNAINDNEKDKYVIEDWLKNKKLRSASHHRIEEARKSIQNK